MIAEILMADVASYRAATRLATDKKINLVFGLNGTGKTILADFLYDPSDKNFAKCSRTPESSEPVLVYSQTFIQDYFYVADSLKGIFSLSKENKAAEEKIASAEAALADLNQRLESTRTAKLKATETFDTQKQRALNEIWKIKTTYSGGDRVLEYCLKGLMGQKEKLFSHLTGIKKPETEPEKSTKELKREVEILAGDSTQMQPKLANLEFNAHDVESNPVFGKPIVGNENSAVAGLIEKLGNSDWVRQGLHYLPEQFEAGSEPCPFCQEPTITPNLAANIRGYFDGAYRAEINQLETLFLRYKQAFSEAVKLESFATHAFVEGQLPSITQKYRAFLKIVERNISTFEAKLRKPGTTQVLEDSAQALDSFNDAIAPINDAIQAYNEKLQQRDVALEALKDEFWLLMRWQYDQTIQRYEEDLASVNSKLSALDAEIKRIEIGISSEKDRVSEAQKETINVDAAVNAVNSGLLDLGIEDYRVTKHSERLYRVVRVGGSEDAFHTLSEGEKMIISFLYFCELCKGRQSATDTETKRIAVIDDPISSLSHIFVFNVGQLIRNVFFGSQQISQVFVLTHSLYFFYELTDPNHGRRKITQNLYRITKSPSGSKIHKMRYEEIQNDYQAYWSVINNPEEPPALIANCMRNIVEYFFSFVRRKDLNNVFQMPELQHIKFQAFCRYVNRESHSFGQNIIDMKEFDYETFKEGLRLIFEATGYADHFKAMSKTKCN